MSKKQVAIIMGSDNDFPVMKPAEDILKSFGVSSHVEVISAHRDPEEMQKFAKSAAKNGFQIIIAGAGGAAHLPGMVASLTTLPVIGVPVQVGKLNGLDALLSVVQMPKGIPVATMAIDNATNAGLLAARILGLTDKKIAKHLQKHELALKQKVKQMKVNLRKKK